MWLYVPSAFAAESADWNSEFIARQADWLASFAGWNGEPRSPQFWRKMLKKGLATRLSGLTLEPLMASHGVAQWIASLRDSHVSHSASPVSSKESMTHDTSGPRSSESSERLGQNGSSLKTFPASYQPALLMDDEQSNLSSKGLDAWVTGLRRDYSARLRSARHTRASGSSSWPTATMGDGAGSRSAGYSTESGRHEVTTLTDAMRQWLTPSANEDAAGQPGANMQRMLSHQVREETGPKYQDGYGPHYLNPRFVEWLMGLPPYWVSLDNNNCEHSGTQSSPQSQPKHGRFL